MAFFTRQVKKLEERNVHTSLVDLIGKTPLLELQRFGKEEELLAPVIAKLEYFNPSGSVKDRAAIGMIEKAEADGILTKDTHLIEPTSGNTGIALAFIAAARGYDLTLVMPETMSQERRDLLAGLGAKLVLSEGAKGMPGAIALANELRDKDPKALILQQFENAANPDFHYKTTGPEIWADTGGHVDIFVSGIGTGGTITGAGKYLKEKNPDVLLVGIEPAASPVISKGYKGPHKIQGIGAGFVPDILNLELVDEIIAVEEADAKAASQTLAHTEGLLVGISSGAALWAAAELAKRPENQGKNIVVLLPDTGERYLSTGLFTK